MAELGLLLKPTVFTEIRVEIIDSYGHLLFIERVTLDGYFQRRFNLSMLEEGSFTFRISTVDISIDKKFQEIVNWPQAIAASK